MKHKRNEKGFHHLGILLVVVLVIIGAAGYLVFQKNGSGSKKSSKSSSNSIFMQQYGENCVNKSDADVSFTSPPMALSDINYIRPLGATTDGHVTPTDHVYIVPKSTIGNNKGNALMPADGVITEVDRMPDTYTGDKTGVQVATDDHRIIVSFSCRYFAIFIHVHKLASNIDAIVETQKANSNKKVNITLKAGDPIGVVGENGYDWVPIDLNITLKGFITPSLYDTEPWKIHTISPFDLYIGSLKSQLEATSLRKVAPLGGKIDYDEAGKLIGNWFRQGTNGYVGSGQSRYWDGHLSVAPDSVDPTITVVSIGNWEGTATQFKVKGSPDPSIIDANSGMVKYELIGYMSGDFAGIIAFQVESGEKLKVEKFVNKTPDQVTAFTSSAQTYER